MIEKFSYSFRMFAFLLVIGIINDQQYSVIFFGTCLAHTRFLRFSHQAEIN